MQQQKFFLIHGFSWDNDRYDSKEAGVSKATMYGCFKNKEAMFAAVIERQCTNMQKQVMSVRDKSQKFTFSLNRNWKTYL